MLRNASIAILFLVLQEFLVLGAPFWAVANAELESNFVKQFLALLSERSRSSLGVFLVLLALTGDPVSKARNFTLSWNQNVPMIILVLLQLFVVLLPVFFSPGCECETDTLEDTDLVLGERRFRRISLACLVVLSQLDNPFVQVGMLSVR